MVAALLLPALVVVVGGLSGLGLAAQGGGWQRNETPEPRA
jgi:hypothetical protein